MSREPRYSLLHLQMGQEVIYLVLTVAVVVAVVMSLRVQSQRQPAPSPAPTEAALQQQLDRSNQALDAALSDKAALEARIERLETALAGASTPPPHENTPPIITLSEAKGYFFRLGSAELEDEFRRRLTEDVIPSLLQDGPRYGVDVIEVVGHTDEVVVAHGVPNLDETLLPFLRGQSAAAPHGVDNAGLGMARAAAVVRFLIADGRLADYTILPLSAGQTIETDGTLALGTKHSDERERRRIEIRMRRRD